MRASQRFQSALYGFNCRRNGRDVLVRSRPGGFVSWDCEAWAARGPMHVPLIGLAVFISASSLATAQESAQANRPTPPPIRQTAWEPLFDGKTLDNWQRTKFGVEGPVTVEDGQIVLEMGRTDLTGITWTGPQLPKTNYELALQAMRLDGKDFFAGITFPVADSFCSLILGGWGGTVVGLSSIDGMDASENETSQSIDFDDRRWYDVRIRVTPERIQAWLDQRQIIDQDITGKKIDTRIEVELSKPLGVAAWRTKSTVRNIRLRRL